MVYRKGIFSSESNKACNEDLPILEAADKGTLKTNFSITILYTCGYSTEITPQGCVSAHKPPTHTYQIRYCYSSYSSVHAGLGSCGTNRPQRTLPYFT